MNLQQKKRGLILSDMNKFKVIIAGGRDFNNYDLLERKCDQILSNKDPTELEIVSGTARGADKLGEVYAAYRNINIKRFPANWDLYKKAAGYIRNKDMAEYADALIAFWDRISKGTFNMIELAKKYELLVRVVRY